MSGKLDWKKAKSKKNYDLYERWTEKKNLRSDRPLGFGKYKKLTPDEIAEIDIKYYQWLASRPDLNLI